MTNGAARIRKIAIGGALLCAVVALSAFAPRANSQSSDTPILGYAWSDTIGWIDLNCRNSGMCASHPFGLSVASDGTISGYAWSEHIGWVSAQRSDTGNCPNAPCTPTLANNVVTSWLKALGGNQADAGGWDGWISISGPGYGLRLSSSGGFSGYSWGEMNIGWVDWRYARLGGEACPVGYMYQDGACVQVYCPPRCDATDVVSCAGELIQRCDLGCANGRCNGAPALSATLSAAPSLVGKNRSSTISWTSQNAAFCTVTGTNDDAWTGTAGTKTSTPITAQTTYTLRCTGAESAQPSSLQKSVTIGIVPSFREI